MRQVSHQLYNALGCIAEVVVCTWALGAAATAAGTAELARIDPAALSARIAGMMMVRPMRMISSMASSEVSSLSHGFGGTRGHSGVLWSYSRFSAIPYTA